MNRILYLLCALCSFGPLWAQERQDLNFTLEQAIAYALEHNYKAVNADRDILAAQKQKWETIATGLPQINGAVSYQNQLIQQVVQLPGEIAGGEPGTFVEVVFGQPQQVNASATLSQLIFDGSYIVGVQASKTFLEYNANNKEKTQQEVRKAIVEAYGNVLLAQEGISILENNKATLEKTLYETSKLFENGLGDEESVEQLQITLATTQSQLRNALRLRKITHQMFNLIMGLELDAPTVLSENLDDLAQDQIDLNLIQEAFNIERNVDYKLALNLNDQRLLEWKLARSKAMPSINGFVTYGALSFSDRFSFLDNGHPYFDFSSLGVNLNIPIFSSVGRSAATQRAKIALEKAKTQLTEAEAQIRLQLENGKSNYTLAIEQYATAKSNLKLAERIEQKNQTKYAEGIASSFELRQAQTQLYTAQREFLQSMIEVINKKTALELIMNNNL